MSIIEFMRDLVAKGMSWEDAADFADRYERGVAQAVEAARPTRSNNAERQARFRAKRATPVTDNVISNATSNATDLSLSPSSPTPPSSTNPIQLPPIVPQKASPERAEKASSADDLAERLWFVASQPSRTRSGRAKVRRAVALALKAGAHPASLEASVLAICRESREFVKGLHLIVEGEHWRDYGPKPPSTAAPIPPEIEEQRIRHLRDTGEWRVAWGERPKAA